MWSVCVCVYYFFLKKTLNVFQKNDKKTVLIPDIIFFFSQKISKMETKYKNALKEFSEDFFLFTHSGEEKKTWDGYSWTHCLYNRGRTNGD